MWRESRFVPIRDCGEELVQIPLDRCELVQPHPYQAEGAPYGRLSPYYLRRGVLQRLESAAESLHRHGCRIMIFDAYRPVAVQEFMVQLTLSRLAAERGHAPDALTEAHRSELLELVGKFWAVPTRNPATPPPHSTGAAIDITLADDSGQALDMGGPIDEISARSWPDHYADATDERLQEVHSRRLLLRTTMSDHGFEQHPNEWWHFSHGDQLWAWLVERRTGRPQAARYGAAEPDR